LQSSTIALQTSDLFPYFKEAFPERLALKANDATAETAKISYNQTAETFSIAGIGKTYDFQQERRLKSYGDEQGLEASQLLRLGALNESEKFANNSINAREAAREAARKESQAGTVDKGGGNKVPDKGSGNTNSGGEDDDPYIRPDDPASWPSYKPPRQAS